MNSLRTIKTVFKRELGAYFNNPQAYVFIFIFVLISMVFAFIMGGLLERREASLSNSFFVFHPWLYMIFGPAIGMRLWSEEHRLGTIELLLTMPISTWEAITGKFLAACCVVVSGLVLTFPIVITLGYLGEPDYGIVFSGYLGSFLVGAATVAITMMVSAFTRSQIACLVASVCICFFLTVLGFWMFIDFLEQGEMAWLADFFSSISLSGHADSLNRGLFEFRNIVYYISMIAFALFTTSVVIRAKRA